MLVRTTEFLPLTYTYVCTYAIHAQKAITVIFFAANSVGASGGYSHINLYKLSVRTMRRL